MGLKPRRAMKNSPIPLSVPNNLSGLDSVLQGEPGITNGSGSLGYPGRRQIACMVFYARFNDAAGGADLMRCIQ